MLKDTLPFFFGQNESYREEFLNERKEKERVLSLKDKLKRDLENAQSRISSLQEQVGSIANNGVKRNGQKGVLYVSDPSVRNG